MTQIFAKQEKSEDDFHFINSYYKNYAAKEISQLKVNLEESEYKAVHYYILIRYKVDRIF